MGVETATSGFDVLLADGTTAHVRAIAPSDASAVVTFYSRLSPASIVLRYFEPRPEMDREDLRIGVGTRPRSLGDGYLRVNASSGCREPIHAVQAM
jgi:hypothetical protein